MRHFLRRVSFFQFFVVANLSLFGECALAAPAVGQTAGSFSVSPSGAANYSVSIETPPNVGDVRPSLALTYSSGSGNGLPGYGWSLSGLSVISRCPTSPVRDGMIDGVDFDDNDKFCLDGERLVNVGGNTFHTEIDNFALIRGGESGFTVTDVDGLTLSFGLSSNSRIKAQGRDEIMTWALERAEDSSGNHYEIQYENFGFISGEYYPKTIYFRNAENVELGEVGFSYGARDDISIGYIGGSKNTLSKRLESVNTFIKNGEMIKSFKLSHGTDPNYGHTIVERILECSDAVCLRPLKFDYGSHEQGFETVSSSKLSAGNKGTFTKGSGDFNGDGITDLSLVHWSDDYGWVIKAALGKGDGTFAKSQTSKPSVGNKGAFTKGTGDFNGDGITDFSLVHWSDDYGWIIKTALGNGDGTFAKSQTSKPSVGNKGAFTKGTGDFNGDGITDFSLVHWSDDYGWIIKTALGNGDGTFAKSQTSKPSVGNKGAFTKGAGDFNGDGITDLSLVHWSNDYGWIVKTALGNGDGTFAKSKTSKPSIGNKGAFTKGAGDFNGDGITDLSLVHWSDDYGWVIKTALGMGDGTFAKSKTSKPSVGNKGTFTKGAGDFNGDGITDLSLVHWSDDYGWIVKTALSHGDGTFANSKTSKLSGGHGGAYSSILGDFNGDGATDLSLVHWSNDYGWTVKMAVSTAELTKLESYHYSEDNYGTISYGLMTDSDVYTKLSGSVYPIRDLQYPKALVVGVSKSNGLGGLGETNYRYSGLRFDVKAKRSLGFQSIVSENVDTGIKVTSTYNQTYPFTGMKESEISQLSSGQELSRIVLSGFQKVETASGYAVWFPYNTTRHETSYLRANNLGLAGQKDTRTVNTFNSSGQITQSVVETWGNDGLGKYKVETNNTYQNYYSKRRQGEIVRASVTSSAPMQNSITRTSSFEYDWLTGKLVKEIIEPNNSDKSISRVTNYSYDRLGNRTSVVTCDGSQIASCSTATPDARFSKMEYDSNGLYAIRTTNALGHAVSTVYDERFGKVTSVTDANGLTATTEYDSFGRTISSTNPLGVTTTTSRAWCGSSGCGVTVGGVEAYYKVTVSGPGQPAAVTYYDELNRVIRKQTAGFSGQDIFIDTEYDSLGRVYRNSEPYFAGDTVYWNTPEYDVLSRKISVITPNQDGSYDYSSRIDYQGFTTTVTDGLGRSFVEVKDVVGNVIEMTDKAGGVMLYEYDAIGKMVKSTDPAGNVIRLTYDQRGRKIRLDDPDMGIWKYDYNTFDQIVAQTDAKGQKTTMTYDRLGRKISRTDLAGTADQKTAHWVYDTAQGKSIGKLHRTTMDDGTGSTVLVYDNFGRVKSREQTIKDQKFTAKSAYNGLGQLTETTYPITSAYPSGFKVRRTYNARGYLTSVDSADGAIKYWSAIAMSARGQLEAVSYGNGIEDLNAHSQANGWLIAQQSSGLNGVLRDSTYHFDAVGNITQRDDVLQGVSEVFGYDDLDRLTDAYIVGGSSSTEYTAKHYAYDALGNITDKSDVGTYSYSGCGGRPHAVCSAGNINYTYDKNGSMVTAQGGSGTTQVGYAPFNKSNFMQKGNHAITFEYNGDRKRHFKSHLIGGQLSVKTYYVGTSGEGSKIFEQEVNTSGTKDIHYIYGAGGQAVATHIARGTEKETNYFHRDHLGSVVLVTNDGGEIVNRAISYDAWGKRRNPDWSDNASGVGLEKVVGNIGFTGQESVPEIGLTHMNGRVYDSALGRFLSADPLIQAPYNSQSYNRYSYVLNNPLGYIDPTGYSWISKKWKKIKRKAVAYFAFGIYGLNKYTRAAVTTGICIKLPGPACGAANAANAYAGGASTKDALKVGARSYVASSVGASIADWVGVNTDRYTIQNIVGNGISGGIASEINGGQFKTGFIASGVAASFKRINESLFDGGAGQDIYRIGFASLTGGAAAYLSGGNVISGMLAAAFTQHWNGNQHLDAGEAKLPDPSASWVTKIKSFFGLPGGKPGNVVASAGGALVNVGIQALNTDVASGVAAISIRKNLNLCEGAGNCWIPDDDIKIRTYLNESPPNYKGVGDLFVKRQWEFIPLTKMVNDL